MPMPADASSSARQWRIGENVPWVVPWAGEGDFALRPSLNFPGRTELVQISRPGVGAPLLNGMHVMRQRMGVRDQLCHVCGGATPSTDRYLFPVSTGVFVPMKDGSRRYASHLPPVHRACAEKAQSACPYLYGVGARPARFPTDAGRLRCETNPPPLMEALSRTLPPGLPVVFSYFRVHTAAFSRLVERLRSAEPPNAAGPSRPG